MKITSVKVIPKDGEVMKASVSVVLNNSFVMRGIAVLKRQSGTQVVVMPNHRRADGEVGRAYFHPLNNEVLGVMQEVIMDAYQRVLENPDENTIWYDRDMQEPLTVSDVRVSLIQNDRLVKAVASITIEDAIVFNQIRVIHPEGDNAWLSMPARKIVRQAEDGGEDKVHHVEYFHPLTRECRQALTDCIIAAYEAKLGEKAKP